MFIFAVFDLFPVNTGDSTAIVLYRDATEAGTVSVPYPYLIMIIIVLICSALFMLVYLNRNHRKRNNADELFREIILSRNTGKIWILLKKHSSETLSDMIGFIKVSYSETIEGAVNRDIRTLQKIHSALDRQMSMQKKNQQRELLALMRIDKNVIPEKSTWLHLTNSCAEQLIYCLKRITTPCMERTGDDSARLPEQLVADLLTAGDLLQSFLLHIKHAVKVSDYSDYEQLFFTSTHISEEFSHLRHCLLERIKKDGEKDLKNLNCYLHILQESEELVCILRLLFRASRKLQSDRRF
jgi:hypothetical protein